MAGQLLIGACGGIRGLCVCRLVLNLFGLLDWQLMCCQKTCGLRGMGQANEAKGKHSRRARRGCEQDRGVNLEGEEGKEGRQKGLGQGFRQQ